MADKLKAGIAVRTTFVAGESPKAAKLNSLTSQLQNASARLEAAIGDIHSESYPYSSITLEKLSLEYGRSQTASGSLSGASTRDLDIANLGRLIGPAGNLNPHSLGPQEITESVPTGYHEFALRFPPDVPSAVSFSDTTVFDTYRAAVADLDAAGDYHIDSFGRIYSVSTTAGGTVTYDFDPQAHGGGNNYQDASFNVIPDANQLDTGDGCAVGGLDSEGRRPVTLPTATHHHYNASYSSVVLGVADVAYGQQLYLPKILVDNYASEEEIPGGFLFLKNYTKNKIYKNAVYYYNSPTSILIGGEDITDDVTDGDVFCIVTIGTDITSSIDDLRKKLYHSHDRSFGEPLIPIQAIVGILSAAGTSGVFVPSEMPGNLFPQYLHRDGFTSGTDDNVNDENIMRGDLALGVSGAAAGGHRTAAGESFKLRFWGRSADPRPYFYRDVDGAFVASADQTLVGSFYTQIPTEGFRVRDGLFCPEKGMVAGLSALEKAVKSLAFEASNQAITNPGAAGFIDIDLSDYDMDSAIHTIIGVMVHVRPSTTEYFYPPILDGASSVEWYYTFSDDDGTPPLHLTLELPGSAFSANLDYKVVLFITEEA